MRALFEALTDEQLMAAFKKGDPRAFEVLVRRFRTPIFNFILRMTGNRSRTEDLLQDTWLKVLRNANSYEPKARFATWAYTVARNLCVDEARKGANRAMGTPSGQQEGAEPLESRMEDPRPSPERAAELTQFNASLERALKSLPREQREVFWLREYSGLGFKEIADITSTPENTVKSRMRYALEGLRASLDAFADPAFAEPKRATP